MDEADSGGKGKKRARRYDGWLRLASHYRVAAPLDDFMGSLTHREYLMRIAWLDDQWNKPDRHDYYAMQIAQKIVQTSSRRKRSVPLESFKVPITLVRKAVKSVVQKVSDSVREAAIAASKARWGMLVKKPPPKELLTPKADRKLRNPDDDNATMMD